jgi:hypothetical protein
MNAIYTVFLDTKTWLPLEPMSQAIRGGIVIGLELLYPSVPWIHAIKDVSVMERTIPGWAHKKDHAKLLVGIRRGAKR